MNIYITYDRYERDEWYSVYHIETNKQRAIQHFLETDLIDFLTYGPDDCHSFQLQKVVMTREEYKKLCKLIEAADKEGELREFLIGVYSETEFEVETIFCTDGCSDNMEAVNYYCDKLGIDEDDDDARAEMWEKIGNDEALWLNILKEYIAVTYRQYNKSN